ncbi:MAG: DoxX family protein [Hyphomonadaceae bacterium]|nr:DoxX family protein [Hyphomonadaceae bacterium]
MNFLSKFSGPLLSILRIVSGLLFIQHGTTKLFQFPATEMFATAPPLGSLMGVGGVLEIVGGALLIIGLFTPIVAFIMSGMMAVAYWMFHAPSSMYPVQNGGDAAILFCFIFLYFAAVGGGPWSVDALLKKKA